MNFERFRLISDNQTDTLCVYSPESRQVAFVGSRLHS